MEFFPGTNVRVERLAGGVAQAIVKFVEDSSRSRTKFPGISACIFAYISACKFVCAYI
jgi:hypothetical protein